MTVPTDPQTLAPKTEIPTPPAKAAQPVAKTAHKRKTRKLSPPGRVVNRNASGIPQKKSWLPKRNSSRHRRRPGWSRPEVWFRIVHIAQDGADRVPVAAYREQTVEIGLGPKGPFQNGNVGSLKRSVAPDQTVNALSAKARHRKPARAPRTPRVIELLRMAQEWQRQLEAGEVESQAAIARREGITRARVTQIMGLLRLAPEIQEHILSLPDTVHRPIFTEHALRPIAQLEYPEAQSSAFYALILPESRCRPVASAVDRKCWTRN